MSTSRPRKVTQKQVALEANVSQTLVSHVLSGKPVDVAHDTRQQILEAARRLGYPIRRQRKVPARQRVIAYIRPIVIRGHHEEHWIYDSYVEYYNTIQNHLVEYCLKEGYSLIVRPYDETEELKHWLKEWDVDGVIWHGQQAHLDWVVERFPTLQLIRGPVIGADAVAIHVEEAISLGLEYLRSLGHERIIAPFPFRNDELLSIKRYHAYTAYISKYRLPHWESFFTEREVDLINQSRHNVEEFAHLIFEPIRRGGKNAPTALFLGGQVALFSLKHFQEWGLKIPEQFSIVGIDDISAAQFSEPKLTSIGCDLRDLSRQAVSVLMDRIRQPELPFRKIYLTPILSERGSAAPPCALPFRLLSEPSAEALTAVVD